MPVVAESIIKITGGNFPAGLPAKASRTISEGGVMIHPTATIHGYGCRFDREEPVERIRCYKGRDSGKPMIVLIPSVCWLDRLCDDIPEQARTLADKFWPGGLTLILQASREFRGMCCWPSGTVALRHCAHPFTSAVLDELEMPLVSTSLGHSGEPVPQDSIEFTRNLYVHSNISKIRPPELAVIDTELEGVYRKPSTLVDLSVPGTVRMLRAGAVARGAIEQAIGCELEKDI
jgi:L-threonylcarbamoyladenylate synthase